MSFQTREDYTLINDKEFATVIETNSNQAYFADRIAVKGRLNFGLVPRGQEVKISLADNGIDSSIIIDSIVAMSGNTTADEIGFNLYKMVNGREMLVGKQRFSNNQMPVDFPDGIIDADMIIGATPTRADATIVVYCKPVVVLFDAVPINNDNDDSRQPTRGNRTT